MPRFVYAFARIYGIASIKRGYSYTIGYMVMPLSLLFLFGIISGGSLIPFAILGGLISITASNALSTLTDIGFFRIELKLQDLFVATGISATDYMLGESLSNLVYSLPGMAIYVVGALLLNLFPAIWLIPIAVVLLLLTIAASSLAFIVGSIPKHMRNVWGFTGIISVIFSLVPPIFYPYTILPKPLLWIFMLSPATPASIILQNISNLTPYLWYCLPVLIIETIVYFLLAKPLTRWREK